MCFDHLIEVSPTKMGPQADSLPGFQVKVVVTIFFLNSDSWILGFYIRVNPSCPFGAPRRMKIPSLVYRIS
jgi:hypothetical protein